MRRAVHAGRERANGGEGKLWCPLTSWYGNDSCQEHCVEQRRPKTQRSVTDITPEGVNMGAFLCHSARNNSAPHALFLIVTNHHLSTTWGALRPPRTTFSTVLCSTFFCGGPYRFAPRDAILAVHIKPSPPPHPTRFMPDVPTKLTCSRGILVSLWGLLLPFFQQCQPRGPVSAGRVYI